MFVDGHLELDRCKRKLLRPMTMGNREKGMLKQRIFPKDKVENISRDKLGNDVDLLMK